MEVRQYLPLEVVLEFYRFLFPNSEGEIYIYLYVKLSTQATYVSWFLYENHTNSLQV